MYRAALILTTILFLLFTLLGGVTLTFAQETAQNNSQTGSLESPTANNWDGGKQMVYFGEGVINLITCWTIAIPYNTDGCPVTVVGEEKNETKVAYNGEGGGLVGSGSRFITMMYLSPPASGTQYLARAVDSKFGLEPHSAYAQVTGSGAQVIRPVEVLWQLSRNIAYIFYIFIFLAVGFMIMFRQKLNPQTVITVQNALPGLVIGLVLVTFSYFIAGLIVDMAFVLSQFVGVLFLSQINYPNASQIVRDTLANQSVITIFWSYIWSPQVISSSATIGNVIYESIDQSSVGWIFHAIVGLAMCLNPVTTNVIDAGASLSPYAPGLVGGAGKFACSVGVGLTSSATGFSNYIINGLILVILVLALVIALVRLFFSLLTSYITIMVLTIFGPIMILFSSIPGNSGVFSSWWRQMLANTLVFPAVFGLFMLVTTILQLNNREVYGTSLPLLGGLPATFMQLILAYGLLLASPAIPGFIKETLKAKTPATFINQISKNLKVGYGGAAVVGSTAGIAAYKGTGGFLEGRFRNSGNPFFGAIASRLDRAGFRGSPPPKK